MSRLISACLVAEEELGERLGQLGLPDAGGAEEDERAARALRVLEAGAGAADGLADGLDGVLLADDPLVQLVLHAEELLGLLLGELVDGDAGPDREDLGDGLLVDLVEQVDAGRLDLGLLRPPCRASSSFSVSRSLPASSKRWASTASFFGCWTWAISFSSSLKSGGVLHALDAQAAAGLVDEVDGLVGQVAVGDVAVGEVGRGDERLVGDRDPVVGLVAVAQALEDLDRVGDRRLLDLDRLEAALEGGVLLEVLAVLVERGGADGLQLAAGEHRLEDRRRVDGALGGTGTDERVELVDEQDDVAAGADLLEHLLQALLEVAAVAGARRPGRRGRGCRAACP